MTVDHFNQLIVCDQSNHNLQIFGNGNENENGNGNGNGNGNEDKQWICNFGSYGNEIGHFNHPSSICVDWDDNLVVTNRWSHRIEVIQAPYFD